MDSGKWMRDLDLVGNATLVSRLSRGQEYSHRWHAITDGRRMGRSCLEKVKIDAVDPACRTRLVAGGSNQERTDRLR